MKDNKIAIKMAIPEDVKTLTEQQKRSAVPPAIKKRRQTISRVHIPLPKEIK
ncbi:hypothetical protein [Rhizosphaericola mali]|uniref:hypothetical protein n=1 Tax=Rhizosphaericola mali TaxID=2545455 RepID=UPI0017808C0C|nr:hypothetical protein [Rhizosphaericola mali]